MGAWTNSCNYELTKTFHKERAPFLCWSGRVIQSRWEAGHCPECCPGDRRGDRTTSGHVVINIERILTGQAGQRRTTLGQGSILFGTTFSFKHESRNGECTALPGGRASVKGGLGARRIGRHHGERNCHVSLECLRSTAPLTDLLVLQGHLCPTGNSSSLGSPPREKDNI